MAKQTAFALIDAQNARIDALTAGMEKLIGLISAPTATQTAPPVVAESAPQTAPIEPPATAPQSTVFSASLSPAKVAELELRAQQETSHRYGAFHHDNEVIETTVQVYGRDGSLEYVKDKATGQLVPKTKKEKKRLTEDTRVILEKAMATDFVGLSLGVLTAEQLRILRDAGQPVKAPYAFNRHKSKATGNLGFGSTNEWTIFLEDSHQNAFEFKVAAGIFAMAQSAHIRVLQ